MRSRSPLGTWQRMARPADGRLLAGVCLGIAEWAGIHVWLVRLAFVVLGLADGVGVVIYALAWLLLPTEGERIDAASFRRAASSRLGHAGREVRGLGGSVRDAWTRVGSSRWPRPLSRRWIALLLIFVGVLVLMASFGLFAWVTPMRAFGLAMAAVGIGILMSLYEARR